MTSYDNMIQKNVFTENRLCCCFVYLKKAVLSMYVQSVLSMSYVIFL